MFKYLHGNWDFDFTTMFTTNNSERQITRQQQSYMPVRVPRARLDLRKNFFCVRGPQIWNSLPSEMRQSSLLNAFENAYDQLPASPVCWSVGRLVGWLVTLKSKISKKAKITGNDTEIR